MGVRDWWLDAGTTSTAGFITETELGTCAIVASKLAAGAVSSGKLGSAAVTCAAVSSGHITSEKASANLVARTLILPIAKLTASSSAGWDSAYVVYKPIVPMQIQQVSIINTGVWENATADEFLLFRNSSACVAGVTFTTTARAAGTRTCATTIHNAAITADTLLTLKTAFSTCSVSTISVLQIDYTTTD